MKCPCCGAALALVQVKETGAPSSSSGQMSLPSSSGGAPTTLPPYGRSKGLPIAGASRDDLDYYISGCRRTLADPMKSRWHDKERVLLAVLEAELARGAAAPATDPAPTDGGGTNDIPF